MFSVFFNAVRCGIKHDWSTTSDRDFELSYNVGGEWKQTSYNKKGWRVELRHPVGENGERTPVLGSEQGILTKDNFKITTEFDQSLGENFIRVIFNVLNTGSEPDSFDLGAYADIQIDQDDTATVTPLSGVTGFIMESTDTDSAGEAITLLCRDHFDVTNVDALYWGKYVSSPSDRSEIGRNSTYDTLTSTDSVFEISWLNRSIKPGELQSFNVLLAIGKGIRLPPQVSANLENNVFEPNSEVQIPATYNTIYDNVQLELYYKYGDDGEEIKVDSFSTTADKNSQNFTIKFNCGEGPREKKVTIFAKDSEQGTKSQPFVATIIRNQRPTFTVNGNPQPEIYWGDKIEVPITLVDDTQAKIVGEINGHKYEGELNPTNTRVTLNIPTDSLPSKPYELKVYAVDENGYKSSETKTFTVQVKDPPPPIFESDPVISPNNAKAGETVTVTARVQNPLQREYKVKTVINGQTYETTVPATKEGEWAEIKYEVKIPEDAGKTQDLKIDVVNSRGETVKNFDKTIPVTSKEELVDQREEELRKKKKKQTLLWAIVGSVLGAAAIIGGVTYYFLGPAKKKNEEEEDKSENYIDEVQLTDHIAKEVANVNNEIFPVNVENLSEGENLDFVTQDPIGL